MTLRELLNVVDEYEVITVACGKDLYTVIEHGEKSDIEKNAKKIKYLDWDVYKVVAWDMELAIYIE